MSDDEFEKQIADRLYKDASATLEFLPEGATITKFGEMTERQIQWVAEEEAKEVGLYESPFFKKFSEGSDK